MQKIFQVPSRVKTLRMILNVNFGFMLFMNQASADCEALRADLSQSGQEVNQLVNYLSERIKELKSEISVCRQQEMKIANEGAQASSGSACIVSGEAGRVDQKLANSSLNCISTLEDLSVREFAYRDALDDAKASLAEELQGALEIAPIVSACGQELSYLNQLKKKVEGMQAVAQQVSRQLEEAQAEHSRLALAFQGMGGRNNGNREACKTVSGGNAQAMRGRAAEGSGKPLAFGRSSRPKGSDITGGAQDSQKRAQGVALVR